MLLDWKHILLPKKLIFQPKHLLHPPEKTDFSPKEKMYDTYRKIKFSNEKNSHPFQKPIRNPKKLLKQKNNFSN